MEFKFDINNLFGDTITRLDNRLQPSRSTPDRWQRNEFKRQMQQVIDSMGDASARAQGLPGTITTASKMSFSDHRLYIMKDTNASSGNGAAVGILKVGRKKLFVYDHNGRCHEIEPLCVLDFYVHESRQRMGCGYKLFEHMLQREGIRPGQLAIDKPSFKFLSFLAKHYNLRSTLPQVNNFVIFESFFTSKQDLNSTRRRKELPPPHGQGRNSRSSNYNATQNGNGATQNGYGNAAADGSLSVRRLRPLSGQRPPSAPRPPSGQRPLSGTRSRSNSRPNSGHQVSSRPGSSHTKHSGRPQEGVVVPDLAVLKDLKLMPRDAGAHPEAPLHRPDLVANGNQSSDTEDKSDRQKAENSRSSTLSRASGPVLRLELQGRSPHHLAAGASMYSRHGNATHSASNANPNGGPAPTSKALTPPLRHRDAPSRPGAEAFNLHQDYQDRYGHLRTDTAALGPPGFSYTGKVTAPPNGRPPLPPSQPRFGGVEGGLPPLSQNTAWTVFGVAPNHRNLAAKHRAHSRLW